MNATRPCLVLLPLLAPMLCAQSPPFTGTVTDPSGAVIIGARVQVRREAALVAQDDTDGEGRFRFEGLPADTYRISVSHVGFTTKTGEALVGSGTRELAFRLEPASVAEALTVTSEGAAYRADSAATATKLELPLIDVPQSLSVVTRRIIEDRQLVRLGEAADNVAGVRWSPGYGGLSSNNYYIRGFRGSFSGGMLRDGFRDYTFLSARDVAGVERMEFLKGPSSVLYGQGEVGGIVNTISKRPLAEHQRSLRLQGGGFGLIRPVLDLTGPLTRGRTLLYRLVGAFENDPGFRDFHKTRSGYLMPSLTWRVRPTTTVRFATEMQQYRYAFDVGLLSEPETARVPLDRFLGEPAFNRAVTRQVASTLDLTHALSGRWSLRSAVNVLLTDALPDYVSPLGLAADRRTVNRVAYRTDEVTENYTWQNELYGRFDTGAVGHNLVAGAEALRFRFTYVFNFAAAAPIDYFGPQYGNLPSGFFPLFGDRASNAVAAPYVQDQITLRRNLKLVVGLRADWVDSRSLDPLRSVRTNSRTFFRVTPRAGVIYNPAEGTAVYFSYTTSFLPQFGISATGERFDPQGGRQFEVGVKQNLLGERLFATAAVYRIDKANVPTPDPVNPRFQLLTGEQRSQGLEFELTGRVSRTWSVAANYSAIDAVVSRDNRLLVGSRLLGVPKHSMGLLTNYEVPRGPWVGLLVGGGVYAFSARETRLPNVATRIEPYYRTDLNIAYRRGLLQYQVTLKNLNNARYYEAQGNTIQPQAPRHVIASVGVTF